MTHFSRRSAIAAALAALASTAVPRTVYSADAMAALVSAAKAEGGVAVDGPPIDTVREAIVKGFQSAYGIPVSYVSTGNAQTGARVRAERAAGKYLLDVLCAGIDTPTLTFLPSGWLDRVEPILIAPDVIDGSRQFQRLGYPIAAVTPTDGPGVLTGGWGLISLVNKAPHPNAAKLFINWIAGRAGLEAYANALASVSLRNDVHYEGVPSFEFPKKGEKYMDTYAFKFVTEQREPAFAKAREILGE